MRREGVVAAVDLGASSGRVVLGRVGPDALELRTVHRFPNNPVHLADGFHWNIIELHRNVLEGLRLAVAAEPELLGIGIDAWAVDYALMRDGAMLGTPYHYRDQRGSDTGVASVHSRVDHAELYARNGLQFLPFNTVYQLATEGPRLDWADGFLMIPDLIAYWLTGEQRVELTNASTTGLLGAGGSEWDTELAGLLGIPTAILPSLVRPGAAIGQLTPAVRGALGTDRPLPVIAVGSHDTASAVVGVPMEAGGAAYISCGTWALVGVELEAPLLDDAAREAGFTNEGGVDERIRFLHNVMGLWLLSESIRDWDSRGIRVDLGEVLAEAARVTERVAVFNADDPRFLSPGGMVARIEQACRDSGQPVPTTVAEMVRSILESLAAAFATTLDDAQKLTGMEIRVVHLVGGGAQNELLCQLTANRSGRPVLAGPVEATAIGNVLVQARHHGLARGELEDLRSLVARTHELRRFLPRNGYAG